MGCSAEEIQGALGGRFGVNLAGEGGQMKPSPKLLAVIEQVMRDPSKAQDIAAKLQREDPALLMELLE